MSVIEIALLGVSLAMDAFAVSITTGITLKDLRWKHALKVGLFFGGFQFLMPLIGYLAGSTFVRYIESVDHWIAFGLLAVIGGNMIRESLSKEEECPNASLSVKAMLPMAVATSIDALAVGIAFAFPSFQMNIFAAVSTIGLTTFFLSFLGVCAGNRFGARYKTKAEIVGGVVLILVGLKILLEHLGVLPG